MISIRKTSFAALLCPAGVHVVAYRRRRGELRVTHYAEAVRPVAGPEEAAAMLGEMLERHGARGHRVALAATGFGTRHQILTLPLAAPEILRPVVTREIRRFYPDVFASEGSEPIIDFVPLGSDDEALGERQREILVAAVPGGLVRAVADELASRSITLSHWTIVPRSLQRLYESYGGPEMTAAAILLVPGWPLLGFFHGAEIRLFSEPRTTPGAAAELEIDALIEHIERGTFFLRQQFPGGTTVRHLLAAGRDVRAIEATRGLDSSLSSPTHPFGPPGESPGALAAIGAALDGAADDGLNLLPADLRPVSSVDHWVRRLAVASALVITLAVGWWSYSAVSAEARARSERDALAESLSRRAEELAGVREVVDERRAHSQRAALLAAVALDQRRLPEILWPLQAARDRVRLRNLEVTRDESGWRVVLGITATGATSAQAADGLMALADQLGAELPEGALTWNDVVFDRSDAVDPMGGGRPPGGPIAASVEMTFILPASRESDE